MAVHVRCKYFLVVLCKIVGSLSNGEDDFEDDD